jgi:hypothetical protein
MHDRFIRKSQLREVGIPYCGDHALRLAKRGLFPTPTHISSRRVGWFESVLRDWLNSKKAA